MNAEQKKNWVAALKALHKAAAPLAVTDEALREWASNTLAAIAWPVLGAGELDDICEAFLAHHRAESLSAMRQRRLFRYQTDWSASQLAAADTGQSGVRAQLGQTASPYPLIDPTVLPGASYRAHPLSSPTSYLAHPDFDVLDQETIARIASRDTGA